jgi:hypothetical protein
VSRGGEGGNLSTLKQRPWPAPDGGIAATSRPRACLANGGDVLRGLSTANEARNIDRIRAADTSVAVEDRVPDVAGWASTPGSPYRLAGTTAGVRSRFVDLAAPLVRAPLP